MRRTITTAVVVAVFGLTAACSSDGDRAAEQHSTSEGATQQQHNDADVRFAQSMIPHHRQAVTMAEMVPQRSSDEELRELAEQIEQAQDPEIEQLESLLETWDEPVETAAADPDAMSGMMSDADMARLEQTAGSEFETEWVEMMIDHHRGAVEMATTELDDGVNDAAAQLAEDIVTAQRDEIEYMQDMLDEP